MKKVTPSLNPKIILESAKQSSDQGPTEDIGQILLIVGIGVLIILLIVPLMAFGVSGSVVPLLCSAITLVWPIWVTVWICKIKNRQTEAVKVQTQAVRVLAEILEEIKAQRPSPQTRA
jgi:hypothetical protein